MSRDVSSKNKEKRARTSSGESNNSFVKNVTSRVSGLLPATITKWFSSPSSSNANGSAPAADATDSSTDDDALESPNTTQPPAKRMRFSSGPDYETEENCVTNNIETIETTTSVRHETSSYTVQSPPGRTTFRRETNFVSTPIRSPEETAIETTETDATTMFPQHTVSTIGSSVTKKRKSLFGNQSQEMSEASKMACAKTSNNTTKDLKQPAFKSTLLGSPFYAGRTTYGGAASSYINQPNITQRQNTTVKESTSNTDNTISHSARRVMELLESYSSPLAEAKRIPYYTRPTRQEMMKRFSESSSLSPYGKPHSYKTQELHLPSVASILRLKQRSRLNDTTNAARQIIASHSSSSPDYLSYPSSSRSDRTETDSSNKLTTKVKSRLTRLHRGDTNYLETDTMAPLELPKAVLQINPNNLPKFSTPILTKTNSSIETPPLSVIRFEPKSVKPVETKSKPESISSDSFYNFAHPVSITRESLTTKSTPPKFSFGSPERKIDSTPESEVKSLAPAIVLDTKKDSSKPTTATVNWKDASKPTTAAENWKDASKPTTAAANWKDASKPTTAAANWKDASKPTTAAANWKDASKPTTAAANWKDASKPTTASVSWKDASNPTTSAASWKDASKPTTAAASWKDASKPTTEAANWNCPDCWANNKPESAKCVCCGHVKAAKVAAKPKCSLCKVADCLADKDKCVICEKVQVNNIIKPLNTASPKWQCKSCWVDNKETDQKCVCCGESNPKATNAAPNTVITKKPDASAAGMCPKCFGFTTFGKCSKCADLVSIPSNNLDNVIKAQANKWECEHCLVRNESDKTKCLCCEADRPGALKKPENMQFNFGTTNTSFKFGIDPKVQEANLAKAAEQNDKKEESETNNNVLSKAPSFSFGIPAKTTEDKTDAPKSTFSFGLSKQNSIAPTSIPKFGISNKLAETSKDKVDSIKPQETKIPEETKSPVMFGASTPAPNTSTTSQPSVIAVGSFATANKDVPSTQLSLPKTNADAPKSNAFSAPKPEGGLFGIASTSLSTTTSFTANTSQASTAMFQKTDAPKMSLFQAPKSDPPTTATVSLFQKSEAAATAPPPAATAPLFSFGGGQTAQPAPEKPKFNFSYFTGGSKNEVFKPSTFGAPNDSNTSGVQFTMGNTTENPLAVNSLATANNLTGNGLNASLASGNSMLVNPLTASNSMTPGTGLQAASSNMFGTAPKENMWSTTSNSTANLFSANTTSNSAPKPFSFGSSTPFSSNPTAFGASNTSATPAFGSNIQATPTPAFGSAAQPTPTFGAAAQGAPTPSFGSVQPTATPHIFGVPNQNSQPSMFSTPNQNAAMFGSPQQAAGGMQPPSMGMFGRPNVGATPTFGTPSFEAASHPPAQSPAFNFVAAQPSGMFGFGQQQQQPQPQGLGGGQGVYSFGAAAAPAQSGVQFSMGSAPNAGVRRIRKARRSQPR